MSQDQSVATDVGCAFDGVAAVNSNAAFSDGQMSLPQGLVSLSLFLSLFICMCMCMCVCVCVCVCVFIKLHITAQSGTVILVILCHSH